MRKKKTALLIFLSAAIIAACCALSESEMIRISPDKSLLDDFDGWGTSLCWWANRLGYSDTLAQQSADLFFGADGLRLNIMRYNIGGGDDPAHRHITRTDSVVPGWHIYDEASGTYTLDPTADANQINVLLRAVRAAGENAMVEAFSNSPPYFMTVSGCSSGARKAGENNLREENAEDFAQYLAQVTAYLAHDMGLPVVSLSPMNEPNTDYWQAMSPKQEGCHVDAGESQSRILEATAAAMATYELEDVLLAASDETSPDKQITAYNSYSAQAKAAVGRINTHTYSDKSAFALGRLAEKEGFSLWMSEVDGDGTAGKQAGEMGAALWLGQKIISDINALRPSAWIMWQVVDSHISSEGCNGNRDTGMVDTSRGFWGTAVADHDKEEIILTQKYYGFGQFTRYIRPGSRLIACGKNALAAYDDARGEIAVVLLNPTNKEKRVTIDLTDFAVKDGTAQVIRTSGSSSAGEHWAQLADLPLGSGRTSVTLTPNSITTLVIPGVSHSTQ